MILTICYDIIVDNVLQNFAICNWWRCPGQLYFSIRTSLSNNILWLLWHSWFRRSCCNDSCCRLWCCCWCRCSCGNTVSCITDESKLKKNWQANIIDVQDTDKSQCFAINKFDYCFIIQSPHLFSYSTHSLHTHSLQKCSYNNMLEQNIIFSKTKLGAFMHEQTFSWSAVICWSCGDFSTNEQEGGHASNDNHSQPALWIIFTFPVNIKFRSCLNSPKIILCKALIGTHIW